MGRLGAAHAGLLSSARCSSLVVGPKGDVRRRISQVHRSDSAGDGSESIESVDPRQIVSPMEGAFPNRAEAGRLLGLKLSKYAGRDDVIVLGLPRGGVPVAYEVACALRVPLDVFIVRKLGVPGFEELAVGAIASGGVRVLNEDV